MKQKKEQKQSVYDRTRQVTLDQPVQFMLLCKLFQVPPMKMLDDFMTNTGGDSFKRSPDEACRTRAVDYFIRCGYGQDHYTEADIRQMFTELHAIGSLWPETAKEKLIDRHAKWRKMYHRHWFKKWYKKPRRKQ